MSAYYRDISATTLMIENRICNKTINGSLATRPPLSYLKWIWGLVNGICIIKCVKCYAYYNVCDYINLLLNPSLQFTSNVNTNKAYIKYIENYYSSLK